MEIEESGKEGARLAFISIIIILFFLAGGQFKGSNIAIQMVNLEFTRGGVIIVFVWVYLIWLAFRYFQVINQGLSQMVKKEYEQINAYGWSGDLFKVLKKTLLLKENVTFRSYSTLGNSIKFNVLYEGEGGLYSKEATEEAKRQVHIGVTPQQKNSYLFTISNQKNLDNLLMKNLDRALIRKCIIYKKEYLNLILPWILFGMALSVGLSYLLQGLAIILIGKLYFWLGLLLFILSLVISFFIAALILNRIK